MSPIMEIVTFRTKGDSSDEDFLRSSAAMEESFARRQPGFKGRTLGRGQDGLWVDVVHWDSIEAADEAAVKELESPACRPFFALIDESTIKLARYEVSEG